MNKLFEEKRYDDVLKVFSKALETTLKKEIKIEGKGPFMAFVTSQLAFETLLEMVNNKFDCGNNKLIINLRSNMTIE